MSESNQFRSSIIEDVVQIDLSRYTSGLKRDKKYQETVDLVLRTLSINLGIPYIDLYNGLFFTRGNKAKGTLVIK